MQQRGGGLLAALLSRPTPDNFCAMQIIVCIACACMCMRCEVFINNIHAADSPVMVCVRLAGIMSLRHVNVKVAVCLFLQGLPTIRAYGAESAFQAAFIDHLSLNGSWWFAYLASSRWIGFRLDLIATVTLTVAVMLATALRQQVCSLTHAPLLISASGTGLIACYVLIL